MSASFNELFIPHLARSFVSFMDKGSFYPTENDVLVTCNFDPQSVDDQCCDVCH